MILTMKASVAAAVIVGTIAASAGITYDGLPEQHGHDG